MNSLLLTNVRPWGREPVDLVIVDGVIASIRPTGSASRQESSGVGERTGRGQGGREDAAAGKQGGGGKGGGEAAPAGKKLGGGQVGGNDGRGNGGGGEQLADWGRVEGRGLLAL